MQIWRHFVNKFPRKSSKHDCRLDNLSTLNGGSNRSSPATKRTPPSAIFPSNVVSGIVPLVAFKDVPEHEKEKLLIAKLNHCCFIFDFSDPDKNSVEKDLKRQILIHIVDYVSTETFRFTESVIAISCRMFMENLCRTFPPRDRTTKTNGRENEEDPPVYDPAWWHLQVVYELLIKFVSSTSLDETIANEYLDHIFISRLLDLFDSEDPREKDCLKTVVQKIYTKFVSLRPYICKSISNILYTFPFETQKHNGITELLEVFGSVISGFELPLKEEHKVFLCRTLIPLHKPKNLGSYHQELTYCLTQFLEKEPKLSSTLISGLLRYWPVTNSQKEVMFLSELEEVLEAASIVEFQKIILPMFRRIALCLNSSHYQVAERALFLWNNAHIVGLIAENRRVILPLVFPALERNISEHWNRSVLNATQNVMKIFSEMDEELFLACRSKFEEEQKLQEAMEEKRRMTWENLESAASVSQALCIN